MTFLRSMLLTGAAIAFCGMAAAQLVPGGEPPAATPGAVPEAPPVAPPPPPPAAAPVSAPGGNVTKVSFEDVKAVFAGAGVPFEIAKMSSGRPYIVGKPNGWVMFAYVVACEDDTALTGCAGVMTESGVFTLKTTAAVINNFNSMNTITHGVLLESGEPYLKQVLVFNSGVSPTYLRENFAYFVKEMSFFAEELQKAAEGAPAAGGAFSAGTGLQDKLQNATRTGLAEDTGIAGHDAGGAFGK
jgi:hypothetical protein